MLPQMQIIEKCAKSAKKKKRNSSQRCQNVDSAVVSIFVVIFIELTNTAIVNSTNTSKNIETAVLSTKMC